LLYRVEALLLFFLLLVSLLRLPQLVLDDALTLPRPSPGRQADDASLLSKLLPDDTSVDPALLSHFSLLLSQFVLFIGVSAVIPTLTLYGRSLGLSSIANGVIVTAPDLSLLLFSRLSGERADRTQKPAMMAGMALVALFDVLTSLDWALDWGGASPRQASGACWPTWPAGLNK